MSNTMLDIDHVIHDINFAPMVLVFYLYAIVVRHLRMNHAL